MVFDCHLHLSEYPDDRLRFYAKLNGLSYTLQELLLSMDEEGVSGGLLLSPLLDDGSAVPNTHILKLCERSEGRLSPALTVEPSREWVEECVTLFNKYKGLVKAFKIRLGYLRVKPVDQVFTRVYDLAEEYGVPVMFHTGDTALKSGSLEYSHPLSLDELAVSHPNLKIVVCHFGNPWIMDAAEVVYKNPNVYVDISGLFTGGGEYRDRYLKWLAERVSEAIYFMGGAQRVLFGSDYPVESLGEALKFAHSLKVSQDDLERILQSNSKEVFGLD
ncbi:MAG: amidohydrolase family protein [Thermoprotei archaeon]